MAEWRHQDRIARRLYLYHTEVGRRKLPSGGRRMQPERRQ
jgi:hypothetical protein